MTALIYERYPSLSEGEMARLRASVVNTEALADAARQLGLGEHILLGKGEEASGGRDKSSLLADSFEAIVGAVYLDRGLPEVEGALRPLFDARILESMGSGRYDSKTALQELVVRVTGELPHYRIASSGPDHEKRFEAHVFVNAEKYGTGVGRNKKEAEQNAARAALERFQEEGGSDARAS